MTVFDQYQEAYDNREDEFYFLDDMNDEGDDDEQHGD